MIEIDGSFGSGGGQILRTAVGLSALLGKPCRVRNIRAGRPKPGLAEQHLQALRAVADFATGRLEGAAIGSEEITFTPGDVRRSSIAVEIGTAGSVGLVLQALSIAALLSGLEANFRGGATFGKWAVPVVYLERVFFPLLDRMGYRIRVDVEREGFYPRGGALASAAISKAELRPIRITSFSRIEQLDGVSVASIHLKRARVAERQAESAAGMIEARTGQRPEVEIRYVDSACPGSGIMIRAVTDTGIIGGDAVGERSLPAEKVGETAAEHLLGALDAGGVDHHAADQLVPFLALAGGEIKTDRITDHVRTNIHVVERFLPTRIEIEDNTIRAKPACRL